MPFECYFDESYTDVGIPLLVIGGYIFETKAKIEFTVLWNKILAENDIPYFHMNEFGPGLARIYSHLDLEKRIAIEKDLIALIGQYASYGLALVVNPQRVRDEMRNDVYATCVDWAFGMASAYLAVAKHDDSLSIILERGHASDGRAVQAMAESQLRNPQLHKKVGSIALANKAEHAALQAADLLAWQVAKYIKDKISTKRKPRKDYLSLVNKNHDLSFITMEDKIISISHIKPNYSNPEFDFFLQAMFGNGKNADEELYEIIREFELIHEGRATR